MAVVPILAGVDPVVDALWQSAEPLTEHEVARALGVPSMVARGHLCCLVQRGHVAYGILPLPEGRSTCLYALIQDRDVLRVAITPDFVAGRPWPPRHVPFSRADQQLSSRRRSGSTGKEYTMQARVSLTAIEHEIAVRQYLFTRDGIKMPAAIRLRRSHLRDNGEGFEGMSIDYERPGVPEMKSAADALADLIAD